MKRMRRICSFFVCIMLLLGLNSGVNAASNVELRTIRVGFFESEGYHIMDEEGTMSGYGFDFLQMMLRYNNWEYEYVGYDKNWSDMLDMLQNDEIDLVTLADKTPEREELFDYSERSIGTSSTIMTIGAGNTEIIPGEYDTYNGAVVGLVEGSSHNDKFMEYSVEKGFTYTVKYYENIDDLLNDLINGDNIDIAVTSNMRVLVNEIVLDEFDSTEYYAIVKKGNEELLDEINSGISQLYIYSPDWRSELFDKYYSDINSTVISFSAEERQYLEQLTENNTVIKAAMNPELKPYAYFEDGEAKGIAAVLFAEIADRMGIQYEILESKNRWEYKEQLESGEADIDLTAYLDYSIAQKYDLKETDAYINSTMAMLMRKDSNIEKDEMVVAIVRDPTEYVGYNNNLIYQYQYKEYDSIQECIDAVKNGEVDATFRYVYIAEQAVAADYTNNLQYTIMQDYSFSLAIGVKNAEDHRLLSILNKGINSLSSSYTQTVMLEETSNLNTNTTFFAFVYDYPWVVIVVLIIILIVTLILILLISANRTQRVKLFASMEMERFIGYVCESYDTVLEVNLQTKQNITYSMVENELSQERQLHVPFDREYFIERVKEEDLDKIVETFSSNTIEKMIGEGGSQSYIECEIKENGEYQWYSYLIKAVPRDEQHPLNYVVFKKNIQQIKLGEEEQKQVLRDALESAKSASAAKGQFLSRMSHEIRTPLNAVIGYMEIAKSEKENPAKMLHCVENSNMAAKHLLSIINDVLDISSIESGRMKIAHDEFSLKDLITTISTLFFHQTQEKKIKFLVRLDRVTQEKLIGDSLRVNQILMNLLSNAVKFTPENGEITLTVTQANVSEGRVFVKFEVSDTGIGMSEEYQQRLFRPFEQESASTAQKYGGTGLGLSITYNLIHMMGGSIEVSSKQNQGSTFSVSLYFDLDKEEQDSKSEQDFSSIRVLLVARQKNFCEYVKKLLKICKVKSDIVTEEAEVIKQIKRRMDSEYRYDICMFDWNFLSTDHKHLPEQIKKEFDREAPIMIAAAYDVSEIEEEAFGIGISKVITKPFFESTMYELLVSLFGTSKSVERKEAGREFLHGLRILLAEDNEMNMEIALDILQKAGLIITPVTDGKQAVDTFIKAPAGTFDAILMDVQMPVMDGYQATGTIRKSSHSEAATIPIIAMTANAFAEDVNAALASGMNGHIAKPIDYEKLYRVLENNCKKEEHE